MIEVCPTCLKFLQTILEKRKLKDVKLVAEGQTCKSMYHKKLID
jgi:hypothetical protein